MTSATKAPRLTTDDELLGMRLAHRVIRHDIDRLSRLADEMLADPSRFDRARYAAISDYVGLFTTSLHHHHTIEDLSLWPLITESAGPDVDFTALTDDHDELDPLLDDLVRLAGELPGQTAVAGFARTVRRLRKLLDKHLDDEERAVFPLITGYVTVDRWQQFEKEAQRSGRADFDLTRFVAVMTAEESEKARGEMPLFLRAVVSVLSRKQRRRERRTFGADA
ncbi:hemerythrin domain-containing protein [Rhodococcus phenolicus]|uniref:hemerythrin domain-containing protein n=1 Tax=Rhodococcus phenolicus TaxID=263849 RepID=UPI000833CA92|nr:hemerythrin domain-containing protein [Rhodococcus phenolicus]